ncbi:MAG: cation diffusion facilitator family transporter [Acidimicrobiia bacterium]
MAGSSESKTLIILALVANALIAVMKFVAAAVTGSAAMLAEGFHSTADSGNQLFLLRGAAVSRYAANTKHQFGRGKELYFWSLMVAVFLFVGGAVVSFYEGLERFRHPEETTNLAWSLSVLAAAAVFEIVIAFWPAVKEFNKRRGSRNWWRSIRESKDPALMVVLFEDSAAVLGVFIAASGILLGEWTGNPRWDGAASMSIGVLLAVVAFLVAYEVKSMLVGESASRRARSEIRAAVLAHPKVESIGRLLTMHMGPENIVVNLDVDFRDGIPVEQVEAAIDEIEVAVRQVAPHATQIFVEVESAR